MSKKVSSSLKLTKKELDFLSSLIEAQKYKLIFSRESNKSSNENLDIANKIENKLGYVLGY
jgi:hypothetical protein